SFSNFLLITVGSHDHGAGWSTNVYRNAVNSDIDTLCLNQKENSTVFHWIFLRNLQLRRSIGYFATGYRLSPVQKRMEIIPAICPADPAQPIHLSGIKCISGQEQQNTLV